MYHPILFLCMILLCAQATASERPLELTIMTFNIRYGTADDGENSWENRKDAVLAMLARYDADIIGTQECLDFQADTIVKELPQYRWVGVGREADGTGERMAVFFKWQELTPLRIESFWLSETPEVPGSRSWDSACPRMVTQARFHHHGSGQRFEFLDTHFDHVSETARLGAAALLRERIRSIPEALPVIVAGDFNAPAADSEVHRTLVRDGLRDAWTSAEATVGPAGTFAGFGPPGEDDRRIDWLLVRGPIGVRSCETIVSHENGRYVSDHFPVVAHLAMR